MSREPLVREYANGSILVWLENAGSQVSSNTCALLNVALNGKIKVMTDYETYVFLPGLLHQMVVTSRWKASDQTAPTFGCSRISQQSAAAGDNKHCKGSYTASDGQPEIVAGAVLLPAGWPIKSHSRDGEDWSEVVFCSLGKGVNSGTS